MDNDTLTQHVKRALPDLIALYRFGSQASGTAHPQSDVDLAVLVPHSMSPLHRIELAQELSVHLHRDVDLVDLRSASTVMRMQVVSTGECLFSASDRIREEFEDLTYSAYARLNEERRAILDDIHTRGSIYAG